MRKKVIGILDRETGYAARLMEVFNSRNRLGFQAEMFTAVELFLEYSRKQSVEILLIGESLMENALKNTAEIIIVISEGNRIAELEEYPIVYKYQSSELIMRKVLECYAREGKRQETLCRTGTKLYGVYAPQGRSYKSEFAWNLAKRMGREKSVLYLGLNVFDEKMELYNSNKDMADVMYYVKNGFQNLIYLVGSSVINLDGIDCMPAMKSIEDMLHISCEDWLKLIQVISTQSNYDAIIVDVEECVQQFYRILDYCGEVYMPYIDTTRSAKWELCKNYLERVGAKDVWEKAKRVKIDVSGKVLDTQSIMNS